MSTTDQIVVGLDESRPSRAALVWAAKHARATGSPLLALHVLEWPTMTGLYAYTVEADTVYYDASQVESRHRAASEILFASIDPEPGWILRFAQGHAGRILVQESRRAALLVVGAREHEGAGRLLHPSTGHYCLSHAASPVVAVPVEVKATVLTSSSSQV